MAGVLEASFVRVPGQRDRVHVRRSDGSEASWVFPSYGAGLPHDLVHLVVESAFGLRRGFWGRVDAGVDPARINDEANRRGGGDKYRGFGEDRRELLLAEALAAGPWSDPETTDEALLEAIQRSAAIMDVVLPESVTPARIAAARAPLRRLAERWRAFDGKGTLVLRFRPDDPERGFADLDAPAPGG
jgi:hypothetical protein